MAALDIFESEVGEPERTIAWGESLGRVITGAIVRASPTASTEQSRHATASAVRSKDPLMTGASCILNASSTAVGVRQDSSTSSTSPQAQLHDQPVSTPINRPKIKSQGS